MCYKRVNSVFQTKICILAHPKAHIHIKFWFLKSVATATHGCIIPSPLFFRLFFKRCIENFFNQHLKVWTHSTAWASLFYAIFCVNSALVHLEVPVYLPHACVNVINFTKLGSQCHWPTIVWSKLMQETPIVMRSILQCLQSVSLSKCSWVQKSCSCLQDYIYSNLNAWSRRWNFLKGQNFESQRLLYV